MDRHIKYASIHIDVDSPLVLKRFYGKSVNDFSIHQLEDFYIKTFNRAFELFNEFNIKATFFCVGEEIVSSPVITKVVKEAIERGHTIANHTFTHPFALNTKPSEEIEEEIFKCNEAIKSVTGEYPYGFRAPGYAINPTIVGILAKQGIRYNSSSGWHIMNWGLKAIKNIPGFKKLNIARSEINQTSAAIKDSYRGKSTSVSSVKKLFNFPLPTSFFILPYYHTFLLFFPRAIQSILLKGNNDTYLVYLFHIIEFASLKEDNLPTELASHPHIKKTYASKLKSHRFILKNILRKRNLILTENYINVGKY